jgi:hypothetical protein
VIGTGLFSDLAAKKHGIAQALYIFLMEGGEDSNSLGFRGFINIAQLTCLCFMQAF